MISGVVISGVVISGVAISGVVMRHREEMPLLLGVVGALVGVGLGRLGLSGRVHLDVLDHFRSLG